MAVETQTKPVHIRRWQGGQHPTMSTIIRKMREEKLVPYMWSNQSNYRHAVRSHGYDKIIYVIDGVIEITFPDTNQRTRLRSGDRVDIPSGVRHGLIVGNGGAKCVEATIGRRRSRK